MSTVPQENQATQPPSDKELNFRKQEEMFKRQIEQERAARIAAEEKVAHFAQQNLNKSHVMDDDDDDDNEPYVDRKRLKKEFGKVVKQVSNDTDTKIQNAVNRALEGERQANWLKQNPDFNEVMGHAQTFADRDPEMAEIILAMPEGFERQKLVYKNIKALSLHKKEEPRSSVQDKIDANRKSPYYQPSGSASPAYGIVNGGKDISPAEGQNAYKKMMELKSRLRV